LLIYGSGKLDRHAGQSFVIPVSPAKSNQMNKKVWDRCGHCNGTGKIQARLQPKRRCPACEGMGYIQKSVLAANISEANSAAEKSGLERSPKPKTPTAK
jgi:hypothetical protein